MLLYYSQVTFSLLQPDYTLPKVSQPLPSRFDASFFWQSLPQIVGQIGQIVAVVVIVILLLANGSFWLTTIAVAISFIFGLVISGNWSRVLQYFSETEFERVDPQFGHDIGFYLFRLPLWQLLDFWLGGLFLYGLVAVSLIYLLSAESLAQGIFPGFSRSQLRHLYALGGATMLTLALHHWLERYQILYSERGVTYGASYTDVKVQLPIETVLAIAASLLAGWLLLKALTGSGKKQNSQLFLRRKPQIPFSLFPFLIYLIVLMSGVALSEAVQRFVVQPNELALEKPYIERTIALTRAAFNLDTIDARTFNPQGQLTANDIRQNDLTIDNIRLWDTRPILQTNRQLQQIRLYYQFLSADIDRYTLLVEDSTVPAEVPTPEPQAGANQDNRPTQTSPTPQSQKQQVIIAARELDYSEVPQQEKPGSIST